MPGVPLLPTACLVGALLLLAGCSRDAGTPIPASPPAGIPDGLTAEAAASLASLQKVDDHPLYVMHYAGGYQDRLNAPAPPGSFACSLFAALGDPAHRLYGRNFDWEFSPALLLFTLPPDGYASVSLVDLTYLGLDQQEAAALTDLPLADRTALLDAPSMPFDGMNAYGLAVGMAAVEGARAGHDPARPTIGSIAILRQVLDHARDVDEALEIFERYNIDFSGGPGLHYLLADASGRAALVEFVDGERRILPNSDPWHLATNFLCSAFEGDGGCRRYRTLRERLSAGSGRLDPAGALELLAEVSQPGSTQWSTVYDLSTGSLRIAMGRDYQDVHVFDLELAGP